MIRNSRNGISTAYLGSVLGAFTLAAAPATASAFADLALHDRNTDAQIAQPVANATTTFPSAPTVVLKVKPADGRVVGRVRLAVSADTPECSILGAYQGRKDDTSPPFEFEVSGDKTCNFTVTGWDSATSWQGWVGELRNVGIQPESPKVTTYPVTVGTDGVTEMHMNEPGTRSSHGVRIYCPVSHFGYNDPILKPGQPGKSHLHQFIGRTDVDAYTTNESLKTPGRTSCEGGLNIAASYWQPALFSENDEVVMPESMFIYYKTFISGDNPDPIPEGMVKDVPNGLQMLASPDTMYGRSPEIANSNGRIRMSIHFPECIAVDGAGEPVLRYRDMPGDAASRVNSHVSYQTTSDGTDNACPLSHPYRIPTITLVAVYDVDPASGWYLSSDTDRSRPGHSLHADYIAMWDEVTMDRIVQCNREARECEFPGRGQLPERFLSPEGYEIYDYSNVLMPGYDRTPFGTSLTPMLP